MADRPITITASNSSDCSLTLSDHGNTNVDPGDTVLWIIAPGSGVEAITAITMKSSPPSTNIFSTAPHQVGNSANWKGTVDSGAADGSEYIYSISWNVNGGGSCVFDPKIIVNSSK